MEKIMSIDGWYYNLGQLLNLKIMLYVYRHVRGLQIRAIGFAPEASGRACPTS